MSRIRQRAGRPGRATCRDLALTSLRRWPVLAAYANDGRLRRYSHLPFQAPAVARWQACHACQGGIRHMSVLKVSSAGRPDWTALSMRPDGPPGELPRESWSSTDLASKRRRCRHAALAGIYRWAESVAR